MLGAQLGIVRDHDVSCFCLGYETESLAVVVFKVVGENDCGAVRVVMG